MNELTETFFIIAVLAGHSAQTDRIAAHQSMFLNQGRQIVLKSGKGIVRYTNIQIQLMNQFAQPDRIHGTKSRDLNGLKAHIPNTPECRFDLFRCFGKIAHGIELCAQCHCHKNIPLIILIYWTCRPMAADSHDLIDQDHRLKQQHQNSQKLD